MDSNKDSGGPREFKYFSKLPAELRLKIWSYNLPEPRIVPIRFGDDSISSSPPSPTDADSLPPSSSVTAPALIASAASAGRRASSLSSFFGCSSPARIPVNLHVCRDSRREALRTYGLGLGVARQPGTVFFAPDRDFLYFGAREGYMASHAQFRTVLALLDPLELARIERLAVSDDLFWIDGDHYHSMAAANLTLDVLAEIRDRMPGLRELVFVPREADCGSFPSSTSLASSLPSSSAIVRVGAARDLTFVAPKLIGMYSMQRQIETAMDAFVERYPDWRCPEWRIMALATSADDANDGRCIDDCPWPEFLSKPPVVGSWESPAGNGAAAPCMDMHRHQTIEQALIRGFNLLEAR